VGNEGGEGKIGKERGREGKGRGEGGGEREWVRERRYREGGGESEERLRG